MGKWLLAMLLLFPCGTTYAQYPFPEPIDRFQILGAGTSSCGTWVSHRSRGTSFDKLIDEHWVVGFLSGISYLMKGTGFSPFNGVPDSNAVFAWMDHFCELHPLEPIASAALYFARSRVLVKNSQ